jgi:DNA-binding MarR family transcriptional regulator
VSKSHDFVCYNNRVEKSKHKKPLRLRGGFSQIAEKLRRNCGETVAENNTSLTDTQERIIALMRVNAGATTAAIAREIGITQSAVEKAVKRLREKGLIDRRGGDRGGSWAVIE